MKTKFKKIAIDLDGIFIDKPPFVPRKLIEWLYRANKNEELSYRYPGELEKKIRILSHHPPLRPPIKENVDFIKKLSKKEGIKIYAISSRYSFLKKRTEVWFEKNGLKGVFDAVYLNEEDEQPHLFKEKVLKKLKPDIFIDDDRLVIDHLGKRLSELITVHVDPRKDMLEWVLGNKKPKVLIGISYYLPNISGLTIYAANLAEELAKRGYEIEVIASKHLEKLKRKEKKNGVNVKRVWTPFLLGRGPIMPTYPLEVYKSIKNADVVNLHIPQFEGVIAAFWAKVLGKKLILTHHCDLSNWPGLMNQITEKVTYLSLLITGFLADKIVVYTKDYAESSNFLQIFKNKLVYQLPPVKLSSSVKKVAKIGKEKHKVGFAGRIAKEKGLDVLIKTVPRLKKELGEDFKLYLAGPYREVVGGGNEKELEKLIDKYKKYVVLLNALNPKEMNYFYQNMDVVVLPSTQKIESFGFVQVEAMLSGCPVVASDMPGVRMPTKLSEMGKTARPGDSNDLAKKIIDVLKNKKKYQKSKKEIEGLFSYKNTIDEYEKLFSGVSQK